MMKYKPLYSFTVRLTALIAAACIPAVFLCACSALFADADDTQPEYTPAPTETLEPTPEATVFSINPVNSFYTRFTSECGDASLALRASLDASKEPYATSISIMISEHFIALSKLSASVCRLFPSEDGGYYGAVVGALNGEGTMYVSPDGVYAFTFYCEDGTVFKGEYSPDTRLEFYEGNYTYAIEETPVSEDVEPTPTPAPVFIAKYAYTIEKTADGWTSTVSNDSDASDSVFTLTTVFTLASDRACFECGAIYAGISFEGNELVLVTAAPATPAQ